MNDCFNEVDNALTWFLKLPPYYHVKAAEDVAGHSRFFSIGASKGTSFVDGEFVAKKSTLEQLEIALILAGRDDFEAKIDKLFTTVRTELHSWRISTAEAILNWKESTKSEDVGYDLYEVIGQESIDHFEWLRDQVRQLRELFRTAKVILLPGITEQSSEDDLAPDSAVELAWDEALSVLTETEASIAQKIKDSRFPIADIDLTDCVDEDAEHKKKTVQNHIREVNKKWRAKRLKFLIDRTGKNPTRNSVKTKGTEEFP